MIEHSLIPVGEIHGIINWEVASIGARDALSVNTADQGKVCHVVGDQCYILADAAGPTWETLSNTGALEASLTADIATAKAEAIADSEAYADTVSGAALTDAKDYADALATSALRDCGNFDASGGAYPSTGGTGVAGAIIKGNMWRISVAGTLPIGVVVGAGDWIRALVDSPGNTQANWSVSEANLGYIPLASLNGRTTAAAVAKEYMLEELHKLALLCTDCIEPFAKSVVTLSVYGATSSVVDTAPGMSDASGVWKFVTSSTTSPFIDLTLADSACITLSSEPVVLVASFSKKSLGNAEAIGISLGESVLFAPAGTHGGDLTNGCCLVMRTAESAVNKGLYAVTRASGTPTTSGGGAIYADDTRYTFVIVASTTSVSYYCNGSLVATHTTNIPTVAMKAGMFIYHVAGGTGNTGEYYVDLIQLFRLYKTTPRSLGIPSITY